MPKYKRFYSVKDIALYNGFQQEAKAFLQKKGYNFTIHSEIGEESTFVKPKQPTIKTYMKKLKVIRTIPLIDVVSKDDKKAVRFYTEEVNNVLYLRKNLQSYIPEMHFELSEEKDTNGEFVFTGLPHGNRSIQTSVKSLENQLFILNNNKRYA